MCHACRGLTTSVPGTPGRADAPSVFRQRRGPCLASGPIKAMAIESQLEAEAASPGGEGWERPGSPQHASICKSVFPKARARRLCIRDDFMRA